LFINSSLLAVHVARRDHADQGSAAAQGEGDVKAAAPEGLTQRVEPRFLLRVPMVRQKQQGLPEEKFFCF
jgi:hypothetical protein